MNHHAVNATTSFHVTANRPFGLLIRPAFSGQTVEQLPVSELRTLAREHHLLILRGFAPTFVDSPSLTRYAEQWGEIKMWPFGAVLDVREHLDATDHIFDHSGVPLHWDGMYKPSIPEFQLFNCLNAPEQNQGGRTTFLNTRALLADAPPALVEQWKTIRVTYRIQKVVHYGGEVCSPLLVPDPRDGQWVLRYNQPAEKDMRFLNRHALEYHGLAPEQIEHFEQDLRERLHDPRYFYAHAWQQNDVVIADNFALLHGREAFASRCARHLQRVHIHGSPVYINTALKR